MNILEMKRIISELQNKMRSELSSVIRSTVKKIRIPYEMRWRQEDADMPANGDAFPRAKIYRPMIIKSANVYEKSGTGTYTLVLKNITTTTTYATITNASTFPIKLQDTVARGDVLELAVTASSGCEELDFVMFVKDL